MYCPRCAVQNLEDAKFCRGCGTNLEAVSLALSGQLVQPDNAARDWLSIRHEGMQKLIRAIGLLAASFLIFAALGLFSDTNDWVIIWLVFVGWMAAWGAISLVSGIGSLTEAKFVKRHLERSSVASLPDRSPEFVTANLGPSRLAAPLSVTEHTTKSLSQHQKVKSEE